MVEVTGFIYDGAGINILAEYEKEVRSSDSGHYRGNNYSNHFDRRDNINYYNEYYYGNGSLVAVNNISHPGSRWQRPEVSYYHQDVLGSVVMLTGKYGHVKERYEYDAYGSPYTGRFEQGNNMNPYGFTGQRYEVEIKMYAFAYRTYNPVSMRWMTPDPVRDGMNWYQYVNSDPVNLWDPLGLDAGALAASLDATYKVTAPLVPYALAEPTLGGEALVATVAVGTFAGVLIYEGVKSLINDKDADRISPDPGISEKQNISRQEEPEVSMSKTLQINEVTGMPNNFNNNKGPVWKKIIIGVGIGSVAAEPYIKQYLEYKEMENEMVDEGDK
jgi:RHS repeat-associated protein